MKSSHEKTLSPIERALWLAIIAGIFFFMYFIPEALLTHNLCMFKMLTGMDCPLCGMTESVHLAARGEIAASLSKHPLGAGLIAAIIALVPFVGIGRTPSAFAKYTVLFFISGFAAWWLLKILVLR